MVDPPPPPEQTQGVPASPFWDHLRVAAATVTNEAQAAAAAGAGSPPGHLELGTYVPLIYSAV